MTQTMKCTNCGSFDLVPYRLYGESTFVIWNSNAQTMACRSCGHLELYVDAKIFEAQQAKPEEQEKQKKVEEKDEEYDKRVLAYEVKKLDLQKEINMVRKIIVDDRQKAKAVNEAEKRLVQLENQLQVLRAPSKNTEGKS